MEETKRYGEITWTCTKKGENDRQTKTRTIKEVTILSKINVFMGSFSLLIQYFSQVNLVILSLYGRDILLSNGNVRSMLVGSCMNAITRLAYVLVLAFCICNEVQV